MNSSPPRVVILLRATMILLTVAFAVTCVPSVSVPMWLTVVLIISVYVFTTALAVMRAVLIAPFRSVWVMIAGGLCCYTTGTVYSWIATWDGRTLPFPSLADLSWLMFYPLAYAGMLSVFRGMRLPLRLLLDGTVAGLGGAALFSSVVVDVIVGRNSGHGLEQLVTLAYPLGDSLLLATVVCGVAMGRSVFERNPLLVAGLATFVVADTGYLAETAYDAYTPGGPINILYLIGLSLTGMSAWHRRRAEPVPRIAAPRLGLTPFAAFGALILLLVGTQIDLSLITVALAGLTLLAVVARVAVALRELESTGRERHLEARRDPLTGLANRRAVMEHVDVLFSRDDHEPIALLLLDLDRFKEVNDSYGHQAGDELLHQVAARLGSVTRAGDVLGRLGGDEFVLVLSDPGLSLEAADGLADRIRGELQKPFLLESVQVVIDVSIGIAYESRQDANGLFQHADIAMYHAKRAGGGHEVYRRDDDRESRSRLELANALRRDVGGDALVLFYQPKLDLLDATVRGFEALVRWQHPTLGLLTPDVFLPVAEENGLMPTLTHNVLSQAIRQCAQWRASGHTVSVSVNASATDLRFEHFPQRVAELLQLHDLPTTALTIEITETMMLNDSPATERVLADLSAMGIDVSIDDYGTHHSTLSYLRRLRDARELKLDRSFIADMRAEARNATIVRSTIDLAHALGIRVVAEGVEDAETLDILRDWGCDCAQGYHIGRPQPPSHFFSLPTGSLSDDGAHA